MFNVPVPYCKACGISISQHEIDEFRNLCKECYWSIVNNKKTPRCLNMDFTNQFEGIKVRKVTMETKSLPKQDRIYHFIIPNGISPEEWPGLDDSYYACDCYDPCICDEEFVDHFESMIENPNSVRGISMHYHHMLALNTIGAHVQEGKYQNCDYVLMYNFLRHSTEEMPERSRFDNPKQSYYEEDIFKRVLEITPNLRGCLEKGEESSLPKEDMLEWQQFDKPEWSNYNLGIFEDVLEIFPNLKGYLQKGGFIRGNINHTTSGPELRILIFESIAVNENFFECMFKHDFPKLQKFEVYIGNDLKNPVENINVFDPLFSGHCFPELTHLRLAGSHIADEIAYNIAKAPIINQLKSLDLSGGLLHTRGAEMLVNILPKTNLEKLNLSYNVLDEDFYNFINPMKNKSGHPIEITVDPQFNERDVLEEQREMERDIKKWMELVGIWSSLH